jgi:glycerol uptake facilitator-like aquaporin
MKRLVAEALGTFVLVLGGCGSAVLSAAFPGLGIGWPSVTAGLKWPPEIGPTAQAITSTLSPNASATPIKPGGRFPASKVIPYIIAQLAGGIAAGAVLYLIASGPAGLKWPPEIGPTAQAITSTLSPNASATPIKPIPRPVTLGLLAGGRFPASKVIPYIIAQLAGGIAAGAVLYLLSDNVRDHL